MSPTTPDGTAVVGRDVEADSAAYAASTDVAAYDPAVFPDLLDQNPEAVRARFAARFMRAETLDDLFDVLEGTLSKDLVGKRIQVTDVQWAPFESDRGVIPLAICQAADVETGEVFEFATTSAALTMFIRRAQLIKALPFNARVAAKKTRSGQTALNFERV
jgi:hypothetical protein